MKPTPKSHLDNLIAQKALSNKINDGPIDGIFSTHLGRWVIDTNELQEEITRKTLQMYKKHWFARLTNDALWTTEDSNGIPRTHMRPLAQFNQKMTSLTSSLQKLNSSIKLIIQQDQPTEIQIDELKAMALETFLDTPEAIADMTSKSWLLERTTEIDLIIPLIEEYLPNIWCELQPKPPSDLMVEKLKKVLEKITTITELREMFNTMKPNRTSGPSGKCREHFLHAPDNILEAILPIVNDMLEGNYPDNTKMGALSAKHKDLHRFRPICLLEVIYRAVDSRIAKRLLTVIDDLGPIDRDQIGFIKGGNASIALDILRFIIEDSNFHDKPAWIGLLDCSEAFDSLDDPVTDIALSCAGLPDFFIRWVLRSKQLQRRVVISAGGISKRLTAFLVKGGTQGAPTQPVYWAIASNIMISFSKKYGGSGYPICKRSGIRRRQSHHLTNKRTAYQNNTSDPRNTSGHEYPISSQLIEPPPD